jgi:predicted HAD superfamily Cof-like phosphohydrolase
MKTVDDVMDFHRVFRLPVGTSSFEKDEERRELRRDLIEEECEEFVDAIDMGDPSAAFDAIIDLIYVATGAAVEWGWDLEEAWDRVQASNMSKLDADGNPILREDGKVLKGPNFEPPYLDDLV